MDLILLYLQSSNKECSQKKNVWVNRQWTLYMSIKLSRFLTAKIKEHEYIENHHTKKIKHCIVFLKTDKQHCMME